MAQSGMLQGRNDGCPSLRGRLPCLWEQSRRMIPVRSFVDGIESLRQWFNDESARVRLVAIQSPT